MLLRTAHEQEQLSTLSHEQPNRLHGPQLLYVSMAYGVWSMVYGLWISIYTHIYMHIVYMLYTNEDEHA